MNLLRKNFGYTSSIIYMLLDMFVTIHEAAQDSSHIKREREYERVREQERKYLRVSILIIKYVSTVLFSIIINNWPSEFFNPSSEIRQRGISPYLFLLIALSLLLLFLSP